MEEQKLVGEKEFEGMSGIFIAEYQMNNMKMERIVVSNPAIIAILKVTQLSPEAQEEAVMDLVARTPEWLDIEPEIQMERIKAVLTIESVIEYLKVKEVVRKGCDMVQSGIDVEGSVVIEAYYTQLNREQRRAIDKSMSEQQKEDMVNAVNILSGNDKLIDLAAAKLKKMQEANKPKFRAVVPPKKK
jgi:hypothetical protein